jgi:hypothetical protein
VIPATDKKTKEFQKENHAEKDKLVLNGNQFLKEKGQKKFEPKVQISTFKYSSPHLHLFSSIQMTSYFLKNKVFLLKLILTSLGNNNAV